MKIGNVEISVPVMNAACSVAKTVDDVQALCATNAGVVLVGSITKEPRTGNPEPRWFVGDGYALNSFGMPNEGLKAYQKLLPEMITIVHDAGKKMALSIAGFSTEEYVQLAQLAEDSKIDLLELNFGCPNVNLNGVQKPIVSFDPESMKEIIESVKAVTKIPLMIKVSPYSNPADLQTAARVLSELKVAAVVTSNTYPNGFMIDDNNDPVIASELAGVSGRVMLPIGLGQVRQFRKVLPESIHVVGVGGIEDKTTADLYFKTGASIVQAATLIVRDGHQAIDRLIK